MRTGAKVAYATLAVVIAAAIGFFSYQAGTHAAVGAADGGQVVHMAGRGWHGGPGFFPGFLLFPLFIIGIILLVKVVARPWGPRGWHGPHHAGPPPVGPTSDWEARATEWHRRQHDTGTESSAEPSESPDKDWPDDTTAG